LLVIIKYCKFLWSNYVGAGKKLLDITIMSLRYPSHYSVRVK